MKENLYRSKNNNRRPKKVFEQNHKKVQVMNKQSKREIIYSRINQESKTDDYCELKDDNNSSSHLLNDSSNSNPLFSNIFVRSSQHTDIIMPEAWALVDTGSSITILVEEYFPCAMLSEYRIGEEQISVFSDVNSGQFKMVTAAIYLIPILDEEWKFPIYLFSHEYNDKLSRAFKQIKDASLNPKGLLSPRLKVVLYPREEIKQLFDYDECLIQNNLIAILGTNSFGFLHVLKRSKRCVLYPPYVDRYEQFGNDGNFFKNLSPISNKYHSMNGESNQCDARLELMSPIEKEEFYLFRNGACGPLFFGQAFSPTLSNYCMFDSGMYSVNDGMIADDTRPYHCNNKTCLKYIETNRSTFETQEQTITTYKPVQLRIINKPKFDFPELMTQSGDVENIHITGVVTARGMSYLYSRMLFDSCAGRVYVRKR